MQWKIVRSKPEGQTHGLAVPAFIRNMQYFYSSLAIYGDGLIDCWGSVDRDIFRRKLEDRWVVTEAPVDSRIGVHNLGGATVCACYWQCTAADMLDRVEAAIDLLNPSRTGMVNMNGEETEVRGKVRQSKFPLSEGKPYRVDENGRQLPGESIPVFLYEGSQFQLVPWFIYADGSSRVGTNERLASVDEVSKWFEAGNLRTSVPDGARIALNGLGWFEGQNSIWPVKPEERVREAHDVLAMLRGELGSNRRCIRSFREYQADPSARNRERLRQAYEAVPEHLRHYCGDMDSQDGPIRMVLYGEEE